MRSRKRARAGLKALSRFGTDTVGPDALSRQARDAARARPAAERRNAARKAARTRKRTT